MVHGFGEKVGGSRNAFQMRADVGDGWLGVKMHLQVAYGGFPKEDQKVCLV